MTWLMIIYWRGLTLSNTLVYYLIFTICVFASFRRKGKLAACMPKMLQLLEQINIIALAHAWTECSMSVYAYRTQEELSDLMRGVFVEDPIDYYRTSELNPGTLYRLDYYIGLEIMSSAIDSEYNWANNGMGR
jgi:hypothetical protein